MGAADDIFMVAAENTPDLTGTRNYNMCDMTSTDVKFNITDITKSYTIPAVDDFLITKFTNSHIITL
jgi:hypothetical protein